MINTLCHMVFQFARHETRLASSLAMLINHVFFHVGFSTKACRGSGRPQWALNIYICVGTSLIGWFDGEHTLPHGFSVPDTTSKQYQYGHHDHEPCVFPCWLLNQGMPWVWKALNIGTKHIYLCGNKFNWVVRWWTHFATWFFIARHHHKRKNDHQIGGHISTKLVVVKKRIVPYFMVQ